MAFEPKRTTELDELTSIANDDYYIIVDSSDTAAGVTKKVSHLTLSNAVGGGGGTPTTDAGDLTSGTLDDARLSSNVTLEGNTFNGNDQLVKLDGSGKLPTSSYSAAITQKGNTFNGPGQLVEVDLATGYLPSLDGRLLGNLNASSITNGTLSAIHLPTEVALNRRLLTPLTTATTVNLTDTQTNYVYFCSHASGTMVFNLNANNAGVHYTIINTSTGDIQIQSAGTIQTDSAVGNVSLTGRSPGSRRVEVMTVANNQYVVSGDLLP